MSYLIIAIVGAILMRLRGGAFSTLTGIRLGTDTARAIYAVPMGAALAIASHHFSAFLLAIPLFVGLLITGWGPFQGMGLKAPTTPEKSWMRWLPNLLGLKTGTVGQDAFGLAEAGLVFMLPVALVCGWFYGQFIVILAGLLWPVAYGIPRLVSLPTIPNFASGQSWGECFTGAFAGIALLLAIHGLL